MPELIIYSDENEYDVETYIQLYNCAGFLMQLEVEGVNRIIWGAKARDDHQVHGRGPGDASLVGLSYSYATLRPCDMVTVGCLTPEEVDEDVEIALAVLSAARRKWKTAVPGQECWWAGIKGNFFNLRGCFQQGGLATLNTAKFYFICIKKSAWPLL